MDSEYPRAVGDAAAVLSELQDGASAVPGVVRAGGVAHNLDGPCERVRDRGELDQRESFIDATFASAKGGGEGIGKTRRGKGVKILAIVDRHGLPLSVSTHAANHHEVTLVQLSFDFYMIEAKPKKLIGDKAYDSDELDESLKRQGVEMIAPHRSNRSLKTQDGRVLRRYQRRWLVERFFAWLQWKRRLLVRWEYYIANFLGFIQLASITMLLKANLR